MGLDSDSKPTPFRVIESKTRTVAVLNADESKFLSTVLRAGALAIKFGVGLFSNSTAKKSEVSKKIDMIHDIAGKVFNKTICIVEEVE